MEQLQLSACLWHDHMFAISPVTLVMGEHYARNGSPCSGMDRILDQRWATAATAATIVVSFEIIV